MPARHFFRELERRGILVRERSKRSGAGIRAHHHRNGIGVEEAPAVGAANGLEKWQESRKFGGKRKKLRSNCG